MLLNPRRFLGAVLLLALTPLSGCGAGLITGAAASDSGGGGGRTPELSLGGAVLPLVPAPGAERSVLVTDVQLASAPGLEVHVDAAGVTAVQQADAASAQGGSSLVTFALDLDAIVQAVGDPSQADVQGLLSVWADGRRVAEPVPVLLARQPRARLVLDPSVPRAILSPLGQRVMLEVEGLLSTSAADIDVLVTTPDPEAGVAGATVTRSATEIVFEDVAPDGTPRISATLPGNTFPAQARLQVRDLLAGQSTTITNAYYRPEIALALPGQGPTTGGSLLTLIGTALVPYDFSTAPARFDFDRVSLTLSRGDRITELPREDFRTAASALDRLVFTAPPSPDGRPGQVDIVLRVDLDGVEVEVVASQVFLFANPDPFYGPRGAVLDRLPVAARPIRLDNAPSTDAAPDFALLTEQAGVGFVQLLLAQQNGMFQPFAGPRQIGDHEVAAERGPRDLLVGDFDGDDVPDLFVVNEGAASAVHHLVLGQERPLSPLGAVHDVPAAPGSTGGRVADFDGDGLPDLLLVPGKNAPAGQLPQVLLSRPIGEGQPAFAAPIDVPVRAFAYEAFEVADLDDDGRLDVAFVSGTELKLDVATGNGDGTFAPARSLDFVLPAYVPDPDSPAVGLHACRNTPRQSLGVVFAGIAGSGMTPPTIAVLDQELVQGPPSSWQFVSPDAAQVYVAPVEPIGLSLAANLDEGDPADPGPIELVIAIRGEPTIVSLGLLQFDGEAFEPVFGSIEGGTTGGSEVPLQIRALAFDTAFPAPEAKAVFIVHEVDVDDAREQRLSTRLVVKSSGQPVLLPPDAGGSLAFPIEAVVGGNFAPISVAGEGAVRDLALASRNGPSGGDGVTIVLNDGFGGFPELGNTLGYPGLLPDSLTLVPSPGQREGLVFAARDSRLGYWVYDPNGAEVQGRDAETAPLRDLLGPAWTGVDIDDDTRLRIADVDGDGIDDLVALLTFDVPTPSQGDAALAVLRGKVAPGAGEFPFEVPTALTQVHGNASGFDVGDFVDDGALAPPRLELSLCVPAGTTPTSVDGNHVRFFRYAAAAGRYVPSAVAGGPQVMLAGGGPRLCAASDFDGDGRVDLLVACRDDSTLRLFRNTAAPGTTDVDVGAFEQALSSPNALSPGTPTTLRLGDVNGDGNLDAVVWTDFVDLLGARSTAIATYLSTGDGEFGDARFASRSRIGGFDAVLSGDLGDWNRDGVPDLFLGWGATPASAPVNLRVLFGGTR